MASQALLSEKIAVPSVTQKPGGLVAVCNPLLDISAVVDKAFLEKYSLSPNDAILADPEDHKPLYDEMNAAKGVIYSAGGSGQNVARSNQWALRKSGALNMKAVFVGAVAKDKYAKIMKDECAKAKVDALYYEVEDSAVPTGTCAVCITDKNRSLVANLGAAEKLPFQFFKEHEKVFDDAQVIYISGFACTVSPQGVAWLVDKYPKGEKVFVLNVSASYVVRVEEYRKVFLKVLKRCDVLFGNDSEVLEVAKALDWTGNDPKEISIKLSSFLSSQRWIITTRGAEPTIIVKSASEIAELPVAEIDPSQIKDTNGAGDAYMGGFIAGIELGKSIKWCHDMGAFAAKEVLMRVGCELPAL